MTPSLHLTEFAELERKSPTEDADIHEIVSGILTLQARAAASSKRPLARGTHAKGVAVHAEFEVLDVARTMGDQQLAVRLASGIFATPGVYPAIVRFANADTRHYPDTRADVRALSFSITVPPNATAAGVTRLDFSMNSATTFPINDSHAFAVAARVLAASGILATVKALRSLSWAEFRSLLATIVLGGRQKRRTPRKAFQLMRYWSTVPYRHGTADAIKYSATPRPGNVARPLQKSPTCLQDELIRHVNEDAQVSSFDFALQFLDAARMTHRGSHREPSFWIENAAIEWNETEAPFHTVAQLRILPKSVLPPDACETFAIDVTEHSTPDTRPIGSINRARWFAESASRQARLAQPVAATAWTQSRRSPRLLWGAMAVAALAFAAAVGWAFGPVAQDLPERLAYPPPPLGSNGLSAVERQQYYHLTEGGEAYPMAWLLALEQTVRGADGTVTYRPFLDNIERYGLLPDPPGPFNPYGLPVGVTMGYSQISGLQMMGLNCTACHVGELHYNGRAFRIDGGPSMAFINAFVKDIVAETQDTVRNGTRRARFLDRWRRVRLVPVPQFPVVRGDVEASQEAPLEELDAGNASVLRRLWSAGRRSVAARSLLATRLESFKALKIVSAANPLGTLDGYGRNDAFGVGRNELFGAFSSPSFPEGMNALPADAPVSFPHLWGMAHTSWFQWGVNTNSVIQRNIGQALGVGALVDPKDGYTSTVRLDHLHAMETLQYKLSAPQWPEDLFGPIDRASAARGKRQFDRTCALCHETYGKTGALNEYQLFPLDVVGTDPSVAINFERTVMTADGPRPFGLAAFEVVQNVMAAYYKQHNTPEAVQAEWEQRAQRPKPEYRLPVRDYDRYPDTRHRGIYRAKTLKGIWATAPFLHNGSVPTLYHLLLPASARPKTFRLGTREYDPQKLGYVYDGERFLTPPGAPAFEFDTTLSGNWNTGHEWWFYPELTDADRYDIIEFLKTFDDATYPGDYTFEAPATLPTNLRMETPLPIKQRAE